MTLFTKTIAHPTDKRLVVTFTAHQELENIADYFLPEDVELARKYDWFVAEVRVSIKGTLFSESSYLGACSYKHADEFMSDESFDELVNEATEDLLESIAIVKNLF
jgi:hypothetical protein